ncbi:hypothetical protein B0H19DRAFT_1241159 [Mycena capillaripes]|nr:hypothetical protein B0H19DRAFT_1241159 [Mycena capillaripes]
MRSSLDCAPTCAQLNHRKARQIDRERRLRPLKDDPLILAQLKEFDGSDSSPIYVSLNGTVFDLSATADVYGSGKSYNIFTGKDGSKGELNEADRKVVDDWYGFSQNDTQAPIMTIRRPYIPGWRADYGHIHPRLSEQPENCTHHQSSSNVGRSRAIHTVASSVPRGRTGAVMSFGKGLLRCDSSAYIRVAERLNDAPPMYPMTREALQQPGLSIASGLAFACIFVLVCSSARGVLGSERRCRQAHSSDESQIQSALAAFCIIVVVGTGRVSSLSSVVVDQENRANAPMLELQLQIPEGNTCL